MDKEKLFCHSLALILSTVIVTQKKLPLQMSFFSVILVSKVEYASTFENFIILPLLFRNFEIRLAVTEKLD